VRIVLVLEYLLMSETKTWFVNLLMHSSVLVFLVVGQRGSNKFGS
jgi:hypothetical protein